MFPFCVEANIYARGNSRGTRAVRRSLRPPSTGKYLGEQGRNESCKLLDPVPTTVLGARRLKNGQLSSNASDRLSSMGDDKRDLAAAVKHKRAGLCFKIFPDGAPSAVKCKYESRPSDPTL
jgi:hypothetical protein